MSHVKKNLLVVYFGCNPVFFTSTGHRSIDYYTTLPQSLEMCVCALICFSCMQLFVTPWTVARQALCPWGFSRPESWSRLPCPSLGDLPDAGIKSMPLTCPTLAGRFCTSGATSETHKCVTSSVLFDSL